jgi:cytochrome c-type biogenesis protein CcsB
MFKNIFNLLFSTKTMALLMVIYAAGMGYATFVENDFGVIASKALVYNSLWFEVVQVMLALNFIGNIKRYNLLRKEKLSVLLFHVAFVVILIGAGITRYVSYEGQMPIREGLTSNLVISDKTYLSLRIDNNEVQRHYEKSLLLSVVTNNDFSETFDFKDTEVEVSYVDFIPKAVEEINKDGGDKNMLHLVVSATGGREDKYIEQGKLLKVGMQIFAYDTEFPGAIEITSSKGGLKIKSPLEITFLKMDNQESGAFAADSIVDFNKRMLYGIGGASFVLTEVYENASVGFVSSNDKNSNYQDLLIVDVKSGEETQRINVFGGKGYVNPKYQLTVNGLNIYLGYGSKYFELPFSLKLNDFILDRYPGSHSPSSFASEVTLIDGDKIEDHRIFMNNVLDYQGYRFFQSSYDQDEKGTILSVNHDGWGTGVSYLGYLLLSIGMFWTLFSPGSRFAAVNKKLKKMSSKTTVVALFMMLGSGLFAQSPNIHMFENVDSLINANIVPREHADKFGSLVIQDNGGRLKPVNTFASELMRKVYRKDHYKGLDADQVLLSMILNPVDWQFIPIIKIDQKAGVGKTLGVEGKYARFYDFFDENGIYKIAEDVEKAYQKKPGARGTYDKEILKVDERVNVFYMAFNGTLLRLFPIPNDENNKWISSTSDITMLKGDDSLFVAKIIPWYFSTIKEAQQSGNWAEADKKVEFISMFQKKYGEDVIPSDSKVKWEIMYNKYKPFQKLFPYYMLVGFAMLIFSFVQLFKERKWIMYLNTFSMGLIVIGFLFHTLGLGARWYISGHAPWSNGYESMIYISWATVLAGFIFARRSKISLSATALLASLILMVSHLNWLDPEVTNLVPVLNSYWLMIHVAIITASYGFVGLAALLGFLVLLIYIFINKDNQKNLSETIKELTYINEMTLTIGLFMLTIGTFLGGIWANESWGRYWGWDPKETWAFVSVFVYVIVLHMRMVPGLKSKYAFNLASVVAFASIIMTYFGVNYYLSGLHSYAAGDPMPVPNFVYYSIVVVFVVAIVAYIRKRKLD